MLIERDGWHSDPEVKKEIVKGIAGKSKIKGGMVFGKVW